MIILIDTKERVIEVEGIESAKDTKRILRETIKNFSEFDHIILPPVKVKVIPMTKNFTIEDFIKNIMSTTPTPEDILDIKPGPPR
jgi:hypothetical protein